MAALGSAPLEPIKEMTFLHSHTLMTHYTKGQINCNFTEPFPTIHVVTIRKCLYKVWLLFNILQIRARLAKSITTTAWASSSEKGYNTGRQYKLLDLTKLQYRTTI
jgi:hypothetical protein